MTDEQWFTAPHHRHHMDRYLRRRRREPSARLVPVQRWYGFYYAPPGDLRTARRLPR
jgi:hypothetical protein